MWVLLRRMEQGEGGWPAQLWLRFGGVLLLGACALAVWTLVVSMNRPPQHNATPAEFGEALSGVVAWTLGWALLIEGPGLFRLIPVPPRHIRFDKTRFDRRQ
ncbi:MULTISPECIES: hypothetical protein [Sphingomonas]|uniref:Uncharacterized protein n=1 Tax=Sphingomonas kyeonggiensis TaxID=1268553 RepID=A0A7W7K3G6_9SPHN|nr:MULTISPECIES: hypothetical protein [Sphingomonas]MBB4839700.1 hypothetical protein [Sphingomonas kyeonggiensis]WHU03092.1 hypothetical protein O3305_00305 [Sphingomonas sp. NIBR02145]